MPDRVPRKEAVNAYNRGLEALHKARTLDDTSAAEHGDKATRKAAKAQEFYARAIEQLGAAVELEPDFYQALGGLGYALLRTGRYEEALESYDRALASGPVYAEAIAERAETCLWLDQIEEAKNAWTQLVQIDRELVMDLMTQMRRWVDARRADPAGLSTEVVESFAAWLDERARQIEQAPEKSGDDVSSSSGSDRK